MKIIANTLLLFCLFAGLQCLNAAEKSDLVVIETALVPANTGLDCYSPFIPMDERFPNQILLNGAESEKVFSKRGWIAWWYFPVALGSLKERDVKCDVKDQTLQCTYELYPFVERKLSIPLVAEYAGRVYGEGPLPEYLDWRIRKAKIMGKRVYKNQDEVELWCRPRAPEFGYEALTLEEIRRVQPWDK